ncbi:MAG: cyclic peptide export ABC transporter [Verrucomicrobia bacterium]|nr:cyclic peptide export ABC transporter [Verrucomicrobiota bacterium]
MKNLIRFLKTESPDPWIFILGMGLLAGVLSGMLLGIVNAAAIIATAPGEVNSYYFLLFLACVAGLWYAKKQALIRTTVAVETMLKDLRVRVCDKIRQCELIHMEPIQKTDAFTKIAHDTNSISQATLGMANACQSIITMFVSLLYLAWLSKPAFAISVLVFGLIAYTYSTRRKEIQSRLAGVIRLESDLLGSLNHIFDGFKELKMNRRKSDALFQNFRETADKNCEIKVDVGTLFIINLLYSEVIFFLLLATLIFVLPRYWSGASALMLQITVTVMFITGPLSVLLGSAPVFARAETSLGNLYGLEAAVEEAFTQSAPNGQAASTRFRDFREVALENATFNYLDSAGKPTFSVGPVTLAARRGELLFIVGGNGSGKSTAVKLLTSLYPVQQGVVRVDHRLVNEATVHEYRELFSIILADFHLFDRLYGLEDIPRERVAALIREMELEDKVTFADGRFNTLSLSTGQRKRLGLIVALLEDRPICVFDEWAADQDQQFRKYFYEVILRNLKTAGKTVIVVTHDDRYWKHADQIVKFDEGRIVEFGSRGAEPAE